MPNTIFRSRSLLRDIDAFLAAEDAAFASMPVCSCCGEHIQQEDIVRIDNEYYCDECLYGMRTQDY